MHAGRADQIAQAVQNKGDTSDVASNIGGTCAGLLINPQGLFIVASGFLQLSLLVVNISQADRGHADLTIPDFLEYV